MGMVKEVLKKIAEKLILDDNSYTWETDQTAMYRLPGCTVFLLFHDPRAYHSQHQKDEATLLQFRQDFENEKEDK